MVALEEPVPRRQEGSLQLMKNSLGSKGQQGQFLLLPILSLPCLFLKGAFLTLVHFLLPVSFP